MLTREHNMRILALVRNVAVIGGSKNPRRLGYRVIKGLLQCDFRCPAFFIKSLETGCWSNACMRGRPGIVCFRTRQRPQYARLGLHTLTIAA